MGLRDWLQHRMGAVEQRQERAAGAIDQAENAAFLEAGLRPHGGDRLRPLSTDGRVAVVGESHYQSALRLAAKEAVVGAESLHTAIPVTALLIPEPGNPYDKNAVRVDVSLSEGCATVGHLPRELARDYQGPLLELTARGEVGWCPGRIMGGGDRNYGIHLQVATPSCLLLSNGCPPGARLLEAEERVMVARKETNQEALDAYRPRRGSKSRVYVQLRHRQIGTGNDTRQVIETHIDGKRVGQLTPLMSDRYSRLFTAPGEAPVCEGIIRDTGNSLQLQLLLPRTT
jgi:hypothetical protein